MSDDVAVDDAGESRRSLLKKMAAGGTIAFAAPMVLTRTAASAASAECCVQVEASCGSNQSGLIRTIKVKNGCGETVTLTYFRGSEVAFTSVLFVDQEQEETEFGRESYPALQLVVTNDDDRELCRVSIPSCGP